MVQKVALICDKWRLPLYVMPRKYDDKVFERPYLSLIASEPRHVSDEALAYEKVCEYLHNNIVGDKVVVEYFGGVGMLSTIIQNILKPRSHIIYDIQSDCSYQLSSLFHDNRDIFVEQSDAKDAMLVANGNMYFLDYNTFSVLHLKEWKEQWDTLFATQPACLQFTDSSIFRLHLNLKNYSKFFGKAICSLRDYIQAFSDLLYNKYGYSIAFVSYHTGASYCVVLPGKNDLIVSKVFNEHYKGFKWII